MVPITYFSNQKAETSYGEDCKQADVVTNGFQTIKDKKHLI